MSVPRNTINIRMRSFELLFEKNLSPSDFYKKNRLDSFISKLEKKEPFIVDRKEQVISASPQEITKLKSFYKFYDQQGDARKPDASANIPLVIGGIPLSKIAKTAEFGGRGGFNVEKANVGPAIEVLKAVAIYSKLTDRSNQPVTQEKIQEILGNLKSKVSLSKQSLKSRTETFSGSISQEVPDQNQQVNDTILLQISANEGPFLRAIALKPDDRDIIGSLKGILNYVNTDIELARYNRFFNQNNRKDSVKVAIVGGLGEKTDVKTTYTDPTNGEERTLKSLSMSLKAGRSASVDQAPGTNEIGIRKFFDILGFDSTVADSAISKSKFKGKVGTDTPGSLEKRKQAAAKILSLAGQYVESKYFSKNDKGEAAFVKEFLQNLVKAMTKEESLIYVEFNADGTYNKLNPKKIVYLADYVDLYADLKVSNTGVNYLYFRDRNTGKSLFHVRLMVSKAERIAFFFVLDSLLELVRESVLKVTKSIN
jgi:hypothetical protein